MDRRRGLPKGRGERCGTLRLHQRNHPRPADANRHGSALRGAGTRSNTLKLTIGQKILFGYGLAMLCMAMTGIAAYGSIERLIEANDWVKHTFLVIGEAQDIRAGLLQIESTARGYVATGDERFLEPIDSIRAYYAASQPRAQTLIV